MKKLVIEQTSEWSTMIEKHKKAEWELHKQQVDASREEMKKLIEIVQVNQNKQLQIKHDKLAERIFFYN